MKLISGVFNFQHIKKEEKKKDCLLDKSDIQQAGYLDQKQPSPLPVLWLLGIALGAGGMPHTLCSSSSSQPEETCCPCRKGLPASPACFTAQSTQPLPGPSPSLPGSHHGSGSCFSSTVGIAVWFREQSVLLCCLVTRGRQSNCGYVGGDCSSAMAMCTFPCKHMLLGSAWWWGARYSLHWKVSLLWQPWFLILSQRPVKSYFTIHHCLLQSLISCMAVCQMLLD